MALTPSEEQRLAKRSRLITSLVLDVVLIICGLWWLRLIHRVGDAPTKQRVGAYGLVLLGAVGLVFTVIRLRRLRRSEI